MTVTSLSIASSRIMQIVANSVSSTVVKAGEENLTLGPVEGIDSITSFLKHNNYRSSLSLSVIVSIDV